MIVYAESSAVLSWLLGEPAGPRVRRVLEAAELVVASDLTLIECDRAFHRSHSLGDISSESRASLSNKLNQFARGWILMRISVQIVHRARGDFPGEAIRSLDSIHLATALGAASTSPGIAILTLDERLRRCAEALGLQLLPATD